MDLLIKVATIAVRLKIASNPRTSGRQPPFTARIYFMAILGETFHVQSPRWMEYNKELACTLMHL